jgi:putative lysine transport system permease protein
MWEIIQKYAPEYGFGIATTLILAVVGTVGGFILGIFLGIGRTLKIRSTDSKFSAICKRAINSICNVYIWVFRGTPMMIQGMIFFLALPIDWIGGFGDHVIFNGYLLCGSIVIVLNTAAYIGEIIRGGIESIDKGQGEAARSLGMTYTQSLIKVVLPQAIRNSIPAIGNEFIVNIKDSSVLNVIGLTELFAWNKFIITQTADAIACYVILAIIYLTLTLIFTLVFKVVEKKLDGKKVFKLSIFRHTKCYVGDDE